MKRGSVGNIHRASIIGLTLVFLATGCEEDVPPTGTLLVPFQFGIGTATCGELGVVEVRGRLDDFYEEEVECAPEDKKGQILFSEVEEGSYPLQLEGLDQAGVPAFDTPVEPVEVRFEGDEKSMEYDGTLSLSTAPARLELRWNLGFGSCESTEIERFLIEAFSDEKGVDEALIAVELACSRTPDLDDDFRRVPDPERDVDGDRLRLIKIQSLDENGVEIGDPVLVELEPPGAGRTVQFSIECTAAGCEQSQ